MEGCSTKHVSTVVIFRSSSTLRLHLLKKKMQNGTPVNDRRKTTMDTCLLRNLSTKPTYSLRLAKSTSSPSESSDQRGRYVQSPLAKRSDEWPSSLRRNDTIASLVWTCARKWVRMRRGGLRKADMTDQERRPCMHADQTKIRLRNMHCVGAACVVTSS